MTLTYNLAYQSTILVHLTRRQSFAGNFLQHLRPCHICFCFSVQFYFTIYIVYQKPKSYFPKLLHDRSAHRWTMESRKQKYSIEGVPVDFVWVTSNGSFKTCLFFFSLCHPFLDQCVKTWTLKIIQFSKDSFHIADESYLVPVFSCFEIT